MLIIIACRTTHFLPSVEHSQGLAYAASLQLKGFELTTLPDLRPNCGGNSKRSGH
jgi:hypothetical protein